MMTSDAELLRQYAQHRSEAAFRELVERHGRLVYALCRRNLGDEHLAEDATQKVFDILWRHAGDLEFGRLDGYLAKLALFVSRRMSRLIRARERIEFSFERAGEENERVFQEAWNAMPALNWDKRVLSAMERAVEKLRRGYRDAVMFRYIEGMSITAAAEAMDVSRETAKKRLARGLRALRRMMKREGFSLPTALVGVVLRRLRMPTPVDLVAKIMASRSTSAPPVIPYAPRPRGFTPFRIASAIASVVAFASVLAMALMPRVQQVQTAQRVTAGQSPVVQPAAIATPTAMVPATVTERLGRTVRWWNFHSAPFDYALRRFEVTSGIDIEPQWNSIEAAWIRRDAPLKADFPATTAAERLQSILETVAPPGTLEYVISDDHVIVRPRVAQVSLHQPTGG